MPVFGLPEKAYLSGGIDGPPRGWPGRPVRRAVVLGGGGNRGAAQVGMMRAIVEAGVVPDLVVGTSIGAINGAALAGQPNLEGVSLCAETWRRIALSDVFPRSRFHGSWRFVEKRPSVFSMERLRQIVASELRFEQLEDAPVPFLVIASRLEDGREQWFTSGPTLDILMASAALPGIYPTVKVGEHHYFDGGVLDNVGIQAALACGARQIYVFLCGRVDAPAPSFSRPFEAMFSAFTLALGARLRRDLARIPEGVDVIVSELGGAGQYDPQDFSRTDDLIEEGYQTARLALDDYESHRRRNPKARRGDRLRRWVSQAEKSSLADEVPPGSTR